MVQIYNLFHYHFQSSVYTCMSSTRQSICIVLIQIVFHANSFYIHLKYDKMKKNLYKFNHMYRIVVFHIQICNINKNLFVCYCCLCCLCYMFIYCFYILFLRLNRKPFWSYVDHISYSIHTKSSTHFNTPPF
jgi:hypothetical protein